MYQCKLCRLCNYVHVLVYVYYALDVGEGPWGMCSKMDSHPFLVDWHSFAFTTRQRHIRHLCMYVQYTCMHACEMYVCIHCTHNAVHACVHVCMNTGLHISVYVWTNKFVTVHICDQLNIGPPHRHIYHAHMTKKRIWDTHIRVRYSNTLLETIHAHYFEYNTRMPTSKHTPIHDDLQGNVCIVTCLQS